MIDTNYPAAAHAAFRPLAALAALADAMLQRLRIGRTRILSGQPIDLVGFEGEITQLCHRSLGLDPQDGRLFRHHLLAVRAELDATISLLPPQDGPCHATP